MTATPTQAVPQPTAPPPRRRRSMAWAFAAGFVVILLVVGTAALFLRGDDISVADEPAPPTPPSSPIDVESLEWTRIPLDAAVFEDARIRSVTVFQGRLVAAGEDSGGAAVWTSPDGITWTRVALEVSGGGQGRTIRALTPGGPGLVAIVESDTVWTSPDGTTWTPSEQAFARPLVAITPGGPGLVMVGDGPAYTSIDGMEWTAARCPDCSTTREFDYMADVTAGGPGLIGVGNYDDPGEGPAFYWTSPYGQTWTRFPFNEVIEMESITAGGPGFVAVGRTPVGAGVLTSPDGTNWSLVPHNEEVFGGSLMRRVVAFGDGLIALGVRHWSEGQAWTSPDGMTWTQVQDRETTFGDSSPADAVAFGGRIIVVGESSKEGGPVWIAAPPGSTLSP